MPNPLTGTVAVRGLEPLVRGTAVLAGGGISKPLLAELPKLAEPVAAEARSLASSIVHVADHQQVGLGETTVAGYQAGRRGIAAVVRQRAQRTGPGDVHRFGSFQMRKILIPALRAKEEEVIAAVDEFVGSLIERSLGA